MERKQNITENVVKVIVPFPVGEEYDYILPDDMAVQNGDIVAVTFGRKETFALVVGKQNESEVDALKLKKITAILMKKAISPEMITFIRKVAEYNLLPLGNVLKMVFPIVDVFRKIRVTKATKTLELLEPVCGDIGKVKLTPTQQKIADSLAEKVDEGYSTLVLKGLTGSGKTEVYFEAMDRALQKNQQVLVLLPEIMLTSQWLERFKRRFGVYPALWHSDLSLAVKRQTWQAVVSGQAKVLVGARSALFLPFNRLGLIVVDEEHDVSFKQEEGAIYQARDMAVLRAAVEKIPIILSSATPSLETIANVQEGKYSLFELKERYNGASLPKVTLIDMKAEAMEKINGGISWISPLLTLKIQNVLQKKEQALLFLNRRGYAPLMLCRHCGNRITCPNCSTSMVEHRKEGKLICHYCNTAIKIPCQCPACGQEESLVSCGSGVERIMEEVALRFPNARTVAVTSDTLTNMKDAVQVIRNIEKGEVDIIVGTQMLTKGYHFPALTLIGVIDADLGLTGADMRGTERTFQMLHQVAGRAGREHKMGEAFLQTYLPQNGVLKALAENNEQDFIHREIEARRFLGYPPYGRMAAIIVSGDNQTNVMKSALEIAKKAPPFDRFHIEVLGPAPAPLFLLKRKYRFRLLVKAPKNVALHSIIKEWMTKVALSSNIRVQIDIDPYNFM